MTDRHPMQPVVLDESGVARFKGNAIVRHLLDSGAIDMNALALLDFSDGDRNQFSQLIGYSLGGWSNLTYVDAASERAPRRRCTVA